ncbi:PREDICTED: probable plastid-lipid-associated protein 6, chloroplastic isoform X6 [Populus euphratica]|uniref:Probable plastid-lipid-associated protein 6, chloroplastic isoform X6 n=1 Tax=Populus euphratica TaxID=75702 RepID=A0AAJ6X6X6_POPEU|nr:PREDICTED: probable plastid-lipid-associated protein 6, chloroplastic isoform X6 [Populus euphratica]
MATFSCSARPTKLYAALPLPPAKHGTSHHSIMLTFPSSSKPKNNNSRVGIDLLSSSNNNPDDYWGYWRTNVSFFQFFSAKGKDVKSLKQQLLEAIAPLDRGAVATPQDQQRVDEIAQELEAVNDIKEPFKSNLLNGKWELLYTTSQSILKTKRPKLLRPNGKIYQAINVDTLRAQNLETWPFFNQNCRSGTYFSSWYYLAMSMPLSIFMSCHARAYSKCSLSTSFSILTEHIVSHV